jgi:hypothetical protein
MVEGEPYAIADIGMRMLQPRELYRAQGFPDTYRIDQGADGRAADQDGPGAHVRQQRVPAAGEGPGARQLRRGSMKPEIVHELLECVEEAERLLSRIYTHRGIAALDMGDGEVVEIEAAAERMAVALRHARGQP